MPIFAHAMLPEICAVMGVWNRVDLPLDKCWNHAKVHPHAQLPLLKKRWVYIVCGAAFQYVHGLGTQLAHRMHRPQAHPLHDIGFEALPVSSAGSQAYLCRPRSHMAMCHAHGA